jgi:hypothetical protein
MSEITPQSKARSAGTDTALERLRDRESIRTLCLVQRMILEEVRRCGTSRLEKIRNEYARQNFLYVFDQMLTFADDLESRKAQEDSLADAAPDDTGDADDE